MSDSYHPFLRGKKTEMPRHRFPPSPPIKRIQGNSALNARDLVLRRDPFNPRSSQYPLLEPAYFDIARERIPERGRACSSSNHARLRFLLITIEHRIFVPSPREFPSSSPLGERRGGGGGEEGRGRALLLRTRCISTRFHVAT